MKLFSKRGAALLQVLLVAAILAGMATMLLRASFSRTSMARRSRRVIAAQTLINRCQAQVNAMWAAKNPANFNRDLRSCYMTCSQVNNGNCINGNKTYSCSFTVPVDGVNKTYTVQAKFTGLANNEGYCEVEYTLTDGNHSSPEVVL